MVGEGKRKETGAGWSDGGGPVHAAGGDVPAMRYGKKEGGGGLTGGRCAVGRKGEGGLV